MVEIPYHTTFKRFFKKAITNYSYSINQLIVKLLL